MSEQDLQIQQLRRDVAKWKNRAVEVASIACMKCQWKECERCRVQKIKEEAGKE